MQVLALITERVKSNWKSGITVALVSIPLSISLAIASGATPLQGIITAVWAGLIASIFAGSNFNIIGPAGALSGILATFAMVYGFASLPSLAIVVGILLLLPILQNWSATWFLSLPAPCMVSRSA
ncbi:MAG: SulP family inorganic anion transporter [bacterium]|nr:SulP family inorganic anion transporter [bacterium]